MSEIQRILDLPEVDYADVEVCPEEPIQALFCRPDAPEGWRLRPKQIQTYYAVQQCGGGLAILGVGAGKTLALHLLPRALGLEARDCLVLAEAKLLPEAAREVEKYRKEFFIEPIPYISFQRLSHKKQVDYFKHNRPRAIFVDEAQWLASEKAAVTRRVARYLKENPEVAFVALSASLTKSSLHDFAHLANKALQDLSPLPRSYSRLSCWANLIDSQRKYGGDVDWQHAWSQFAPLAADPRFLAEGELMQTKARSSFAKRLASAPGVVVSTDPACDIPIGFERIDLSATLPESVAFAANSAKSGMHPDNWLIESPAACAEVARQCLAGFYYYFDWGEDGPDLEWLHLRSNWHCELNRYLSRDREGRETPALVVDALEADEEFPEGLVQAYADWLTVSDREPPPQAVRLLEGGDYLANWARAYCDAREAEGHRVAVWFQHIEFGRMLEAAGFCLANDDPHGAAVKAASVAYSLGKHSTGLNLQAYFDEALFLQPPSNGPLWEQAVGRVHRPGSKAARIRVAVVDRGEYDVKAIRGATHDAEYYAGMLQSPQKILDFALGKSFGIKSSFYPEEKSAEKATLGVAKLRRPKLG